MPLCARLPLLVAADMIPHLDDVIAAATGRALERARVYHFALHAVGELAPEQGAANICSSFAAMSARVYSCALERVHSRVEVERLSLAACVGSSLRHIISSMSQAVLRDLPTQ